MMKKVVGIVGNFNQPSRTYQLAENIVNKTAHAFGMEPQLYNLSALGSSFPNAQSFQDLDDQAQAIIKDMMKAEILVISVPTWNASYPGMFKHLFDLISPDAMRAKPMILAATGGSERHALMVEYQVRPLFNYFKACPVTTSIYATSTDWNENGLSSELNLRIGQAVSEIRLT